MTTLCDICDRPVLGAGHISYNLVVDDLGSKGCHRIHLSFQLLKFLLDIDKTKILIAMKIYDHRESWMDNNRPTDLHACHHQGIRRDKDDRALAVVYVD